MQLSYKAYKARMSVSRSASQRDGIDGFLSLLVCDGRLHDHAPCVAVRMPRCVRDLATPGVERDPTLTRPHFLLLLARMPAVSPAPVVLSAVSRGMRGVARRSTTTPHLTAKRVSPLIEAP